MIHEKSSDTRIIESMLKAASVGQLITYDEISTAIGRDVRKHASSSLVTARRSLLLECGIVFGVERGVGLKRLDDEEIVDTTESDRVRILRASKRTLDKLSVVKFDSLPEDYKRQHVVASAQMGAISLFSKKTSAKKIATKVQKSTSEISIGETLSLFNK
ncbi:MAG: hypothetical protein CMK32_10095 [Porticoccaceae bacterium]|nr:hypothetical protein [Porticoccaceae bacterium]